MKPIVSVPWAGGFPALVLSMLFVVGNVRAQSGPGHALQIPNSGFPRVATSTQETFDDMPLAGASRFYQLRLVP